MTQAEQGQSETSTRQPEDTREPGDTGPPEGMREPEPRGLRGDAGQPEDAAEVPAGQPRPSALARHPVLTHLAVLTGYVGLGLAVTWPRVSYLTGRLPYTRDAGSYVWGFWWLVRSITHLSNPWTTSYLAAPVGTFLGLHTLMPLADVVMAPVTVIFGPSASYNLLCSVLPGLLAYVMYRAARLWLPQLASIAAGGFFGYSSILDFWVWNHINLAAGALFVPMTVEAAVRLRRRPGPGQAVVLGVILGASVLVDQDSALMAAAVATAILLPWLFGRRRPPEPGDRSIGARVLSAHRWARLLPLALAVLVTGILATPQLLAIRDEIHRGGHPTPPSARDYLAGARFPNFIEPSPRLASFRLHILHSPDYTTYGVMLTLLAITGLVLTWRRPWAWVLALSWFAATVVAMGSCLRIGGHVYIPLAQRWHGARLSSALPFTWLVQTPGLASFRIPARVAEIGLVPAALLAGLAVNWLRQHAVPVLVAVLALAVVEAGLSTPPGQRSMPTAMPALDRPIAADRSGSIVVDVPFGIRGGVNLRGMPFAPQSQVLATADGHPLAVANLARIPLATDHGIRDQAFYADLMAVQKGYYYLTPAHWHDAAVNVRRMHVGWVLMWYRNRHVTAYLLRLGFRFAYRADGVSVYRLR